MKAKYLMVVLIVSLLGSRAAVVIDPCWQVYIKTCYSEGSVIYKGPTISCGDYHCVSETWYINSTVTGSKCYELRRIGTVVPSGYTRCRNSMQQHLVNITKVRRYCIPKLGCVSSSPVIEAFTVSCEDDRLDTESEACVPAS